MTHLGDRPLVWDSAMQLAPGVEGAEIVHLVAAPTMENTYAEVVTEPAHGEVFAFRDSEHSELRAWYIPEEGFVGTDTAAALAAFRGDEAAPAPEDEEE